MLGSQASYAADLTWAGTTDNTWDTVTANWSGDSTVFTSGDNVTFSSLNPANRTVAQASSLTIGSITLQSGFTGSVTLSAANTVNGTTTLNGGTLIATASGALGTSAVTLNGGTFRVSTTLANNVSVTGATNIQTGSGIGSVLSGNWSGSGNLTLQANGSVAQWQFGGDNSGYTGTFTQNSGNTSLAFNSANSGSANAAWVFNNGTAERTRFNFGTGTILFGSLSGSGALANVVNNSTATVQVGALDNSTTFSGTLKNGIGTAQVAALTKVGTGTLTLTGGNTYTGATTINAGTLALGAANRISNSSAMVLNGGTFATGGFAETLNTLTLSSSSTIDFGSGDSDLVFAASNGTTWTGTLTLLNFDIGTDSLNFTSVSGLTVSQLNQIALAGYSATGLDASGFVQFSAIPEPSTYAAIFGSLALAGASWQRRRHQTAKA